MKFKLLRSLAVVLLAGLYSWLFTKSGLGINTLIFSVLLIGCLYWLEKELFSTLQVRLAVLGVFLSAIMIVWHHSVLSQVVHLLSLFLCIGFVQERQLRFFLFAGLLSLQSFIGTPLRWAQTFSLPSRGQVWYRLQYTILPVLLLMVFGCLYYEASPYFTRMIDRLQIKWEGPGPGFWMLLLGFLLSGAFLLPSNSILPLQRWDQLLETQLVKGRRWGWFHFRIPFRMMGLKREFRSALVSLCLLNALLLVVNVMDVPQVWWHQKTRRAAELSQFVHEGTTVLMLAIFLAMAVLSWFFRGNLNFFPDNKDIRLLRYAWIIQNGILALSVGMRNLLYVGAHGLTHLRIGVFWFLLLVLAGLVTFYFKIYLRKSFWYLILANSWVVYLSFLVASFFNWDLIITRYNLSTLPSDRLDTYYLIREISDKNTPLLELHKDKLNAAFNTDTYYLESLEDALEEKRAKLTQRIDFQAWQAWNLMDHRLRSYLTETR